MKSYLLRRLWQSLLVIFGVSVVVFLILHLTGDPAALLLPPDATAEDIALRDRKNEFHLGAEPPEMRHLLMEPTERR